MRSTHVYQQNYEHINKHSIMNTNIEPSWTEKLNPFLVNAMKGFEWGNHLWWLVSHVVALVLPPWQGLALRHGCFCIPISNCWWCWDHPLLGDSLHMSFNSCWRFNRLCTFCSRPKLCFAGNYGFTLKKIWVRRCRRRRCCRRPRKVVKGFGHLPLSDWVVLLICCS